MGELNQSNLSLSSDGIDCLICYEKGKTDLVYCEQCKSQYCRECAIRWREMKNQCPQKCHQPPWRTTLGDLLPVIEQAQIQVIQYDQLFGILIDSLNNGMNRNFVVRNNIFNQLMDQLDGLGPIHIVHEQSEAEQISSLDDTYNLNHLPIANENQSDYAGDVSEVRSIENFRGTIYNFFPNGHPEINHQRSPRRVFQSYSFSSSLRPGRWEDQEDLSELGRDHQLENSRLHLQSPQDSLELHRLRVYNQVVSEDQMARYERRRIRSNSVGTQPSGLINFDVVRMDQVFVESDEEDETIEDEGGIPQLVPNLVFPKNDQFNYFNDLLITSEPRIQDIPLFQEVKHKSYLTTK